MSLSNIALVAVAKDEASYIHEWIFHHYLKGVKSFYIGINRTSDETVEVIKKISLVIDVDIKFWDVSWIDYFPNSGDVNTNIQYHAYSYLLNEVISSSKHSHVFFLDIDEFWVSNNFKETLPEFIKRAPDFDILSFDWLCQNGDDSLFELPFANLKCNLNPNVKSILNLSSLNSLVSVRAHVPKLENGHIHINSKFDEFNASIEQPQKNLDFNDKDKEAFILHRTTRSEQEYVSLLLRKDLTSVISVKDNRFGFSKKYEYELEFKEADVHAYHKEMVCLVSKCGISEILSNARESFLAISKGFNEIGRDEIINNEKTYKRVFSGTKYYSSIENICNLVNFSKSKDLKVERKRIFQIGFNKCGTASIHRYFLSNKINSVHWDSNKLAARIFDNHKKGKNLLLGLDDYDAFTDMELITDQEMRYVAPELFKELYYQNPNSLFIFNDRDLDKWIESRNNHVGGNYVKKAQKILGLNNIYEVNESWKRDYYEHKKAVLDFFEGKDNFLYYKIDEHSNKMLGSFLKINGFVLSNEVVPHVHKTSELNKQRLNKNIDAMRDAAIAFEEFDLEVSITLMSKAAELRPDGKFIRNKLNEYLAKEKII